MVRRRNRIISRPNFPSISRRLRNGQSRPHIIMNRHMRLLRNIIRSLMSMKWKVCMKGRRETLIKTKEQDLVTWRRSMTILKVIMLIQVISRHLKRMRLWTKMKIMSMIWRIPLFSEPIWWILPNCHRRWIVWSELLPRKVWRWVSIKDLLIQEIL